MNREIAREIGCCSLQPLGGCRQGRLVRVGSILQHSSILEMSPTDTKLGFATSVGCAGVRRLVVVVVQITGENVNENIKPLCYASNWEERKCCSHSSSWTSSPTYLQIISGSFNLPILWQNVFVYIDGLRAGRPLFRFPAVQGIFLFSTASYQL